MHQSKPSQGEMRYDLLAEIAVGATATVELCRITGNARNGQLVAVKRLHDHIASDRQFVDMFRDEVWMTAALKNEHVVEVVDWGMEPGPWLAVEFVRGVSLQRLMKTVFETGERFTERMVVYLARCICDGLAAAHNLQSSSGEHLALVHRDLTPGNILLGFEGEVKITDFGLAKAKQRLTKTLTGLLKGNPQYMSPEQISGRPIDGRSDIFALGVLLFELFSGRRPWNATSDLDAMRAITDEHPADLLGLRPRIDKALVEVVNQCLEKDPSKRWQHAVELRDRFDQWLIAHGYRDDNEQSLARFVRRNAMRQMRWFDRAVAGEFRDQVAPDGGMRGSVPPPAPTVPQSARAPVPAPAPRAPQPTSPTMGTGPTIADTPGSRSVERRAERRADGDRRSEQTSPTRTPGGSARVEADDVEWGDDGPTLIQKSGRAQKLIRAARDQMPSVEPTTQRRQRAGRGRRPKRSPSRQTVGADESAIAPRPGAALGKQIHQAANAASSSRHPSPDATVQMPEGGPPLGVVAPPDPDVPPLPPDSPHAAVSARMPHPDGTATQVKAMYPEPDGTATQLQPMSAPAPEPPPPPPPMDDKLVGVRAMPAPRYPSELDPAERSSDFSAEAARLGDEAGRTAEAARRAHAVAAAAARASALATEASMLASMGDHHEAIQRLREAQLVDDALKRGEVPHGLSESEDLFVSEPRPAPASLAAPRPRSRGTGAHRALRTRENVTVAVIVAIGLLVVALFAVLLFRF